MRKAYLLGLVLLGVLLPAAVRANEGGWSPTGSLTAGRAYHTTTLLADGRVLVAGGYTDGPLGTAEIYDPAGGEWTATGSLNVPRLKHTAALLPDGRVLVAGGWSDGYALASTELYDPATGLWTLGAEMNVARQSATATALLDGRVLVAGGTDGYGDLTSAELYDPTAGAWTLTGSLHTSRRAHEATLLADGRVLVTGGLLASNVLNNVEVYEPAGGLWTITASMTTPRYNHTMTRLEDGRVLVAGGTSAAMYPVPLAGAALYDPAAGTWTATGSLATARLTHGAALLPDGRVLVAGGLDADLVVLSSSELLDPATGLWETVADLNDARSSFGVLRLTDGKVLAAGGWDGTGYLATAELFGEAETTMHVADIEGAFGLDPFGRIRLRMRVQAVDGSGVPLDDVLVEASLWDPDGGPFQRARLTKPGGYARFAWGSNAAGAWQLCVDYLSRAGYVYEPEDNLVSCGQWEN